MKEAQLFSYLKDKHYPDLVMSEDKMSIWDCYSAKESHRIELKCRSRHYDALILERKKYNSMLYECHSNLDIPIYINSTPKGIYRWNLYKENPNWINKEMSGRTEFDDKKKISKEVALLEIIDAEIL